MKITIVVPSHGFSKGIIRELQDRRPDIKVEVISCPSLFKKRMNGKLLLSFQIVINFLYHLIHPKLLMRKSDTILLNGLAVALPFLFINCMSFRTRSPRKIVIISFFLHGLGSSLLVKRTLTLLFSDRRVSLVAQTKSEVEYYSKLMDRSQIAYVPYCLGRVDFNANAGIGLEYIFAGGFTNRDYNTLIDVAKQIPCDLILAISALNEIPDLPSNIRVLRDISHKDFNGYIKNSIFVIIPLKADVGSSGQMVALTAMSFAKGIVYTDIGCISEYFSPGITGLPYILNNIESLYDATMFMIKNPEAREAMGRNARKVMERDFTWGRYSREVVNLLID